MEHCTLAALIVGRRAKAFGDENNDLWRTVVRPTLAKASLTMLLVALTIGVLMALAPEPDIGNDFAADSEKRVFQGLAGVHVVVEDLPQPFVQAGLSSEQVKVDVELQLRRNGVTVLSREEVLLTKGSPYLYVTLNGGPVSDLPLFQYNPRVELRERVLLVRDPAQSVVACTWSLGGTGSVGKGKVQSIRDDFRDIVDRFSNKWLAFNKVVGKKSQ